MRWYHKAILQKTLSIFPSGFYVNNFLQESFGRLSSFDAIGNIKEIKRIFIKPIVERFGGCSGLKILEIGTGWRPILPTLLYLMGNECISFDKFRHLKNKKFRFILGNVMSCISGLNDVPGFCLGEAYSNYQKIKLNGKENTNMGWKYIASVDTRNLPIRDGSQDVVVSRLVLQHIPKEILPGIICETNRVLKEGGIAIHKINLHDEYAQDDPESGAINFLKFPSWFWNTFINNRIKFVNQNRYPYYLRLFEDAGFHIVALQKKIDEKSYKSIHKMKIAKEFENYSEKELATINLIAVLEKNGRAHKSYDFINKEIYV